MLEQRTCRHCDGPEYKVVPGASLAGWHHDATEEDHWFCSRCSWGSDHADDAILK